MSGPFTKLHHLCVVVADIDRAQRFYESAGIGPWVDYPPLEDYTDLDVPDPDGFRALKYRYAWVGGLQLQLCEPGPEPSPQRQFLDERGEGVFHVGFEVPDIEAAVRGLGAAGVEMLRYPHFQQDALGVWTAPSGARVCWFADPDGNVISLSQF